MKKNVIRTENVTTIELYVVDVDGDNESYPTITDNAISACAHQLPVATTRKRDVGFAVLE